MKTMRLLPFLARLLLAGLMLWAGFAKLLQPGPFAESLYNFRLLSPALAWAGAWLIPSLELVAGLGLLWRGARRGAWLLAWLLCAGFAAFVISAWIRGLDVSCGCFGPSARPIGALDAGRTLVLLALATAGALKDCQGSEPR